MSISENRGRRSEVGDQRSEVRGQRGPGNAAFTMIEIALSLAIIGFALVAIIGILPTGMNVQRDNRQETIVNQDMSVLMNGIRNGERGLDDLTNYVIAITNHSYLYRNGGITSTRLDWYTPTSSSTWPVPIFGAVNFPLTNGYYIIGLLGTPKLQNQIYNPRGQLVSFVSNHIVASFRSMSGPASEKFPQTNTIIEELGLSYKLIPEVTGYGTNFYSPDWTNYLARGLLPVDIVNRSNYFILVKCYETNLHDVLLTFRWPILPNGKSGNGYQAYRTTVSGPLTNDPTNSPFYFFQPNTFFRGS